MKDIEDLFSKETIKQLPLNYFFIKKKEKEKNQIDIEYSSSSYYNSNIYAAESFYKPISRVINKVDGEENNI